MWYNKNPSSQAYAHVFSANFAADCVKNPCRAKARLRIFAYSATKLCSKIRTHFLWRQVLKNTFEIFHNLKVDISPQIKNEFEIQPVRWVVERTFGWMTWSGRLSKDYEIRSFYQENICIISNLQTLLRRF